ncbi:MAG TPA: M50 family metallopeptidase [Candidatus Limnocylindrales bacterium]
MFDGLINVVLMLVVLVVLIVAHEFGHFVLARRAGVTVHEFGIGFPPRIATIGHLWGTPITLNALPLGGFVKLEGENGASDDPHSFAAQGLPTRLAILLAGVGMNALLAIVLFSGLALAGYPSTTIRIGAFFHDPNPALATPSPAQLAGLHSDTPTATDALLPTGDTILAVDGRRFVWFDGPEAMLGYVKSRAGQAVTLLIRHADGSEATVPITLRDPAHAATEGALGITSLALMAGPPIQVGPIEAIGMGVGRTVTTVSQVFGALGSFISDIGHPQVTGPIGIARAVGQTRSEGAAPWSFVYLVALLSANLAILNVLPIPPMDGGRIATSLLRAVGRGRVGIRFERRAAIVGFALLVALVFWVGANDIVRPQT